MESIDGPRSPWWMGEGEDRGVTGGDIYDSSENSVHFSITHMLE